MKDGSITGMLPYKTKTCPADVPVCRFLILARNDLHDYPTPMFRLFKPHTPVLLLAAYMFVVAIAALIRTGSVTPLIIAGSFALVTLIIGLIARKSGRIAVNTAIGWVVIVFLVEAYMMINTAAVHGTSRAGSQYIFGSVAIFAMVALLLMIGSLRSRAKKDAR